MDNIKTISLDLDLNPNPQGLKGSLTEAKQVENNRQLSEEAYFSSLLNGLQNRIEAGSISDGLLN